MSGKCPSRSLALLASGCADQAAEVLKTSCVRGREPSACGLGKLLRHFEPESLPQPCRSAGRPGERAGDMLVPCGRWTDATSFCHERTEGGTVDLVEDPGPFPGLDTGCSPRTRIFGSSPRIRQVLRGPTQELALSDPQASEQVRSLPACPDGPALEGILMEVH